jgi:hypothetical protein
VTRYAEATEKRTTEEDGEPYFVELAHTTPAPLPDQLRADLLARHDEILRRLDFDTGMAHGEYRIGCDGRITLTEIAGRSAMTRTYPPRRPGGLDRCSSRTRPGRWPG